jgi:hypothetical protein
MNSGRCATDRGRFHGWWHTNHLNLIEDLTVFYKNRIGIKTIHKLLRIYKILLLL